MRRHLIIAGASVTAAACATACATGTSTGPASPASSTSASAATRTASPTRGVFTLVRGSDTMASERFSRSAERLQVDFTSRGIALFNYDAALTPQATISRMQVTTRVPGSPERTSSVTFQGDTAILADGAGESARTLRSVVPPGTLPYVGSSASLMEQIIRRARAMGGNSVTVPLLIASTGGRTSPAIVSFSSPDSARIGLAGVTVLLRVDAAGDIVSGSVPAQGVVISRSAAAPGMP